MEHYEEDIVDRLKSWDDQQPPFRTMMEAAKEIERLREEACCWQEAAYELARQLGKREYADVEYENWKEMSKQATH
jgi:hypothetical protein